MRGRMFLAPAVDQIFEVFSGNVCGLRIALSYVAVAGKPDCAGRVGSKAWVKSRCAGPRSSADSNLDNFTGPGSFSKTDTARWGK
jgi:hypothetical protein